MFFGMRNVFFLLLQKHMNNISYDFISIYNLSYLRDICHKEKDYGK